MSETTPSAPPSLNGTQPTAAQVRAAAEALKIAIDRHLAAVEARTDELDPSVLEAFDALASAAEEYDELLYTVHDEVTPFDVVPPESDAVYAGPEQVEAFSVFTRRDFLITDPDTLAAAASNVSEDFDPELGDSRAAVAELFDAFDADEISYRAEEIGLEAIEATTWVVAADPEAVGGWDDDPFSEVDLQKLLYRVDLVDEEELDDEEADEETDAATGSALDDAEDAEDVEDEDAEDGEDEDDAEDEDGEVEHGRGADATR
jgi:hypothetical protein